MMDGSIKCRYLVQSEEAYTIDWRGENVPVTILLCAWAESAPPQLKDVPRWMQRNALGGHLWREGDCEGCPCWSKDVP